MCPGGTQHLLWASGSDTGNYRPGPGPCTAPLGCHRGKHQHWHCSSAGGRQHICSAPSLLQTSTLAGERSILWQGPSGQGNTETEAGAAVGWGTREGPLGDRGGARRKLGRSEPRSVGKQRLRRDLTEACKVVSGEKSINTVLPAKSQGAGISMHSLKYSS